jgi:arginase
MAPLSVLGVPTSAAAFAPGQELAPAALRQAGLLDRLSAAGAQVSDLGDSPVWRWRPDTARPRAQNLVEVARIARETRDRVASARDDAGVLLLLGGDCTIELGTVAGHVARDEDLGLVYFDVHPDLNTPASVHEGALDWMGMAHALGVDGVERELAGIGPRTPLLDDRQVLFFSYGPDQATPFELEQMERRRLARVSVDEVRADPEGTARRAMNEFGARFTRLLVHFDVDTIDFNDAPLSENTGRGEGLPLDTAMRALRVLVGSERLAALTVTELNPLHGDEGGHTIGRLVDGLADCLAGSPALSFKSVRPHPERR